MCGKFRGWGLLACGNCAGVCGKSRDCGFILCGICAVACGGVRDWGFLVVRGRAGARGCVELGVPGVCG